MPASDSESIQNNHQCVRDWVAFNLGIGQHRERDVYLSVWRIGRRIAGSYGRVLEAAALDDCIHDAMLRIRHNRDLLTMAYPASYFGRAVDNACRSALRSRNRDRLQTQAESADGAAWESTLPARDPTIEALLTHEQCWSLVLERLSADQRANLALALELRLHGTSADELTSRTGRSKRGITQAVSNFVGVTLRRLIEEICPGLVQEMTGRTG